MAALSIYALDQPGVFCHGDTVHFPTKKAEELLYFLLTHGGQLVNRDLVAERLWPRCPPHKSHHSLSTALWRLREALPAADGHGDYLAIRAHALGFNRESSYWFDAEVFEQQSLGGLAGPLPLDAAALQALEGAAALYRRDFLEGCCADWCLARREQLQLLLVRVLKRLQCHNRLTGDYDTAIAQGQRLLALDPLLEEVHRELMRCYAAAGRRAQALAQYERCAETLARELHAAPMARTTELHGQIREGQYPGGEAAAEEVVTAADVAALRTLLAEFRRTLDGLDTAGPRPAGGLPRQRDSGPVASARQ